MTKIVFTETEQQNLLDQAKSAHDEGRPELGAMLVDLAEHGIDRSTCVPYDEIKAKQGLPPMG